MFFRLTMVLSDMVLDIIPTSNHLECESTAMWNMCPINGQQNLHVCTCHGAVSQVQGCVRDCGGLACTDWHALHQN